MVTSEPHEPLPALIVVCPQFSESLYYCVLSQASYLTGKAQSFQHAAVRYERPPHWEMYKTMLGCDVEFGASAPSYTVDRDFMKSTITTGNEAVMTMMERRCRETLRRW